MSKLGSVRELGVAGSWTVARALALIAAVLSAGAACESGAPIVEKSTRALNAAPRIEDFVLLAGNSIRLQTGGLVVAGGDLGARGSGSGPFLSGGVAIDLSTGVETPADRNVIADSVRLGTGVKAGDLQTNRFVDGTGTQHGSVSPLVPLPPLPLAAPVSPGTTTLTVPAGGTVTAAPGPYAAVSVGTGGKLRLEAGGYDMSSVTLGTGARLEALGKVVLRIQGRLSASTGAFIGAAPDVVITARDLRIEVSGINGTTGALGATPPAAKLGSGANVTTLLLVPNGTLVAGTAINATGAFMARDLDISGAGARVTFQDGFGCAGMPDGTVCDDGDACTQSDACQAGACVGTDPVVCAASDSCHEAGTCDPATGICSNPAKADGSACGDGDACTTDDVCQAGVCVGSPVWCATNPACQIPGGCDPATGQCLEPSGSLSCGDGVSDGCEQCDDGNTEGGDNCSPACKTAFCGDGDVRRTVTRLSFSFLGRSCNSGQGDVSFFLNDEEVARALLPTTCDCEPGIVTLDVPGSVLRTAERNGSNVLVAHATGEIAWVAVHLETPYFGTAWTLFDAGGGQDGDGRVVDLCAAGSQMGLGIGTGLWLDGGEACDDGNAIDDDACSNACAVNPCHGVVCTSPGPCQTVGQCNPDTGACEYAAKPDGTPCDDASLCTQVDACQGGLCASESVVSCPPAPHCTIQPACVPATGLCSEPAGCAICGNGALELGEECDDGNTRSADGCSASCQHEYCGDGAPLRTLSALRFTWLGRSCGLEPPADIAFLVNEVEVARVPLPNRCDCAPGIETLEVTDPTLLELGHNGANTFRVRTTGELAWASAEIHTPSFGLPMTLWDAGGGGDADARNADLCAAGAQLDVFTGVGLMLAGGEECDDGNTIDDDACSNACLLNRCLGIDCQAQDSCHDAGSCDPATGLCSNPAKPDGVACADGDACTRFDLCQGGLCVGADPVVCEAAGQCHGAGLCNPATGSCTTPLVADGTACEDGSLCTTGDACLAGACAPGTAVACVAADACHLAGTCDPGTGLCTNPPAPNGTTCDDGNACTRTDACQNGGCTGGSPVVCLPADSCHLAGTCVAATGTCAYPRKADGTSCNDNDACTQTDTCLAGSCVGSNRKTCPAGNQCQESGQCEPGSGECLFPGRADGIACEDGDATTSSDGCHAGVCVGIPPVPSPTPTSLASSFAFIHEGPAASQVGVAANTIKPARAASLRGRLLARDGSPLMGVTVSVAGHPEYGRTLSRADGGYDLVVNGGLTLTVVLTSAGHLPAERPVEIAWQELATVEDVVLVPLDAQVTTVDLTQPVPQMAVGSVSTDQDGTRQAVLVVPPGTQAMMDLPNGTTVGMDTLSIRITEVTVGDRGPAAMPAPLPGNTQYTYAVDYSTDEGLAAKAKSIRFSKPIYHYSENFLGFPVGMGVPAGYYDRTLHAWLPMPNGAVVKILAVTDGLAQLDVDGSGSPAPDDWKQAMGITDGELALLGARYQPGQTLWRVPVPHFSFMDYNWTGGPPPDASSPQASAGGNPTTSGPSTLCGSIIEAQNQVVGERIPVTGTPFTLNYRSNRVEGFKAANQMHLALSGASVPESLRRITVEANIAGQTYQADVAPSANAFYQLLWDGRDGIGRPVNGQQPAWVSVGYEYPLVYYAPTDALYHAAIDFGKLGDNLSTTGVAGRGTFVSSKTLSAVVGTYLAKGAGMGGWTLDVNHVYDSQHTLWRGDGERESPQVDSSGTQAIIPGYGVDYRIAGAADGAIYITGYPSGITAPALKPGVVWKYDPATGTHSDFFTLASVPAVENGPYGPWYERQILAIATAPDDSVYLTANVWVYAGTNERYIDHVSPTGAFLESWRVNVDAGVNLRSLAVAQDGTVYYAEVTGWPCLRIWKLTRDGQKSRVAGGDCSLVVGGDGGPAIDGTFGRPTGAVDLALGPDGSLYIANQSDCRVRRIGMDGIITTVAGTTCPSAGQHTGDGGLATEAKLNPTSITVGKDGVLYIGDTGYWEIACPSCAAGCPCYGSGVFVEPRSRIRAIHGGIINSLAGANVTYGGQGAPALRLSMSKLVDLAFVGKSLWYAETTNLANRLTQDTPQGIRRISPPLGGPAAGVFQVRSRDGAETYELDGDGAHLRTLDSLTGALRYRFGYSDGLLTTITDANDLVTQILRDGSGTATSIVAPNGQQTTLGYGDDGYLATLDHPGARRHELTYYEGGLLQTFQNPNGQVSTFTYDDLGRVTGEEMPGGCSWTLTRTGGPSAGDPKAPVQVSVRSAEGRTHGYTVGSDDAGTESRIDHSAAGLPTTSSKSQAGVETQVTPDGMMSTVTLGPDPRGGMQAPIPASTVVRTPLGKQMTVNMSRVATMDGSQPSLASQVDTTSVNGKTTTTAYDATAKTITTTSPEGRQTVTTLDAQGRVVRVQAGNLAPTAYRYDTRGRLETVTVGTGDTARVTTFGYDSLDRLATVTDPLGRTQSHGYDDANWVTTQTFADGNSVAFAYDANGNVTSVTPPGRPAHAFAFTPNDLMSSYTPPVVSAEVPTTYEYNRDKQPTVIHRPDGTTINFTYDSAGRLSTTTYPKGPDAGDGTITVTRSYNPTTGKLAAMSTSDGQALSYGYDGRLLTTTTWSGTVAGSVTRTYNNDFRLATTSVNGANSVSYGYDSDGLPTSVDGLSITRNSTNGLTTDTTLGQVTDHKTYDSFGKLATYEAKFGTTSLYSLALVRDSLGRIEQKTEMIQGTATVWNYSYDQAGRLWQVTKDGVLAGTYLYDANGNRLSKTTPGGTETATYDDQDRLLTYGKWAYMYTPNGELRAKTDTTTNEVTRYSYDAAGNLRKVELPDGRVIDYVIDAVGRRVGKRVNGIMARQWLYEGDLAATAELDGAGTLIARYLDGVTVKGSTAYKVIVDNLRTPRLLVNSTTGAVAQRLDFDEWGQVTTDTSAGFQLFGFAGGIYDPDTGLVRFGARDYDPVVGRWTAKDPSRFEGGLDLYSYAANDPVNRADPSGRKVDWIGLVCNNPIAWGAACALAGYSDITPYTHQNRNDYNVCPPTDPTNSCSQDPGWGEPPGGREWSTVGDGKLRGSDGSECIYDETGRLKKLGSFNLGANPWSLAHVCLDVLPYCWWGD